MTPVTSPEARGRLGELLSRVESGEEVTITRHGRPVAVLVRPDALNSRRTGAALGETARVPGLLARPAVSPPVGAGLTAQRADELIAEIRADRDAR